MLLVVDLTLQMSWVMIIITVENSTHNHWTVESDSGLTNR